jgi:SAM-dependent methyltransferase
VSTTWDESYGPGRPAPWDIGRPQPAIARLAQHGLLGGRVLDAGCGTGEHALLAAAHGAAATGVDVSPRAISRARVKAAERGLAVRFEAGDALDLAGLLGTTFGTAIDSGLFHVFDDAARARYVASLAAVLEPGGTCYLMCFSDREPGSGGPRRVRRDELAAAFAGWEVGPITADAFEVNPGYAYGPPDAPVAQAWLAVLRRPASVSR